jgi:trehalose-6-phosphatase
MPGCRYNINLHAFLRKVARSPRSALLLDYDATLAPFRTERDHAYPYPGVTELVSEIVATGRTRVAFITGVTAHDTLRSLKINRAPEYQAKR